ncbi:MAG: MarR family transcriptional regulator [Burkholderiales bacterium]|nr:MarR family transcriptional regulator [Burkholderiales bacterium]
MNDRERTLLQQLGRTFRAMHCAFEAEVGIPLPRWRILHLLSERPCATQKEISLALSMDPGALTRQMKALEADGLVARRSMPEDNRLTVASLTAKGVEFVSNTLPTRKAFSRSALEGLTAEEISCTMKTLSFLEERFRSDS